MNLTFQRIVEAIKKAYIEACTLLPREILIEFKRALQEEKSPLAKRGLEILIENQEIAQREGLPLCQDTGLPVVIVRFSSDYCLPWLEEAINEGLKEAVKEGYLRASVADPLHRINTGTNTPAVIHYELCKEPTFEIWLMPKGCGSENMSKLLMLSPAKGLRGIKSFVLEVVKEAGPNPCPPLIVGVGIGGNFERSTYLAKRALFRDLGTLNPDPFIAELEKELLEEINQLNIGPLGFGGRTTALAVHIETQPTHIASLPLAVNLQCHSARIKKIKFI
ncbi:MAG: fumarate hydratase [Caldimicrobium sp.]|nr:fumarate hydratase [Caldimicrobium sp.]MCX7872901.1 fumarate hydratase [Caldimicrobium sp.]MDW8094493.1 fumarate hydratase [Caldimicrobium sp.]